MVWYLVKHRENFTLTLPPQFQNMIAYWLWTCGL